MITPSGKEVFVIPAKAGIHTVDCSGFQALKWIPAFAGMTQGGWAVLDYLAGLGLYP